MPAATLVSELTATLCTTIGSLDVHFATIEAGVPGAGADDVTAGEALARLRTLLAEYNGDSTEYFAGVRAALADVLAPAALERLAAHIANYEFDAARQVLDAAAQEAS